MGAPSPLEPWRKNLAALIERFTQPVVMRALEVDKSTVSKWKTGDRWPEPGMVLRICAAFGVTLDQLYGIRGEQPAVVELDPGVAPSKVAAALRRLDEARALLREGLAGRDEVPGQTRAARFSDLKGPGTEKGSRRPKGAAR